MPFHPRDKGGLAARGRPMGWHKRQECSVSLLYTSPLFDRESGRKESVLELLPFRRLAAPIPLRCLGSSPGICHCAGPWHSGRMLRSSWLSVLSVLRPLSEQNLLANPHTCDGSPGAGSQPWPHLGRTLGAQKKCKICN